LAYWRLNQARSRGGLGNPIWLRLDERHRWLCRRWVQLQDADFVEMGQRVQGAERVLAAQDLGGRAVTINGKEQSQIAATQLHFLIALFGDRVADVWY
jgi:hypothetical protein